ncbi:sugar transferase [Chitinophaga alhagiae]|uniref:sugar transferase n=1 Tax=Chitinophaga alhagiae TaxID=2203219 RepID=UPI000E5AF7A8|nr:sugar transferase [Chitinophaga alhagiae]
MPAAHQVSFNLSIGGSDAYDHILLKTGVLAITTDGIAGVKRVLRRQLQPNELPGFIIFNLDEHADIFNAFVEYVRSSKTLSKVPLFVYKKKFDQADKDRLATTGGIDGIVTPATTFEAFTSTLSFSQKIKQLAAAEEAGYRAVYIQDAFRLTGRVAKRGFDIAVAGGLLVALSPLLLLIAAAIRLESKGNVFYIAPRAGKRYQIFKFYKFRTMVADADKKVKELQHLNQYDNKDDKNGAVFFKLSNDPRVTKIGAFLRNTSLDEIPQLINVLKGDMSLVGNRPLPLYEAATLTTDRYAERFIAPAGITGLWQVKKRGKKEMSVDERIGLDIDYAKKHSFFYDMRILANTPAALIQKENV